MGFAETTVGVSRRPELDRDMLALKQARFREAAGAVLRALLLPLRGDPCMLLESVNVSQFLDPDKQTDRDRKENDNESIKICYVIRP